MLSYFSPESFLFVVVGLVYVFLALTKVINSIPQVTLVININY